MVWELSEETMDSDQPDVVEFQETVVREPSADTVDSD